jgi:ABC-2 type transport system ATP-binding protein
LWLVTVALIAPADAVARDFAITSFDGTRIEAHFFPARGLASGSRAPTILYGPGWGNGGATDQESPTSEDNGTVGLAVLRNNGYNVLTWDPRGFGGSGGEAKWDSPFYEARDVQALLDTLAGFPEAKLDGPGDPRVGMHGASYGGGIQWATAAIDDRLEAITPVVAWHSLLTSLYRGGTFKSGWGSLLCGLGSAQGTSTGLVNPDGAAAGSMDSHMYSICSSGLLTGRINASNQSWLTDRGPGTTWMDLVRTPALVLHGTVDTLFTLDEAIRNFGVLQSNGVPSRMMWFCGGHGTCSTSQGAGGYFRDAVLRWLAAHVKGQTVATGPAFEWIDQTGAWRATSAYPVADDGQLTATGSGLLRYVAGDAASSGTATSATPSPNGVNIAIPAPSRRANLLGAPRLELDYTAYGTGEVAHVYAQVVDVDRDIVVGGQVTPVPLDVASQPRTLILSLEPLAYALTPSSHLRLQLIPASNVYGNQRTSGSVQLTRVEVTLPLGKSPVTEPAPTPTPSERCEPRFRPRSVRRRDDGRVRIRPRVRCGDVQLQKRVRITDGRRRWSRRTGRVSLLRVRPRANRLVVRFRHEGRRHKVRVPITS